MEQINESTRT